MLRTALRFAAISALLLTLQPSPALARSSQPPPPTHGSTTRHLSPAHPVASFRTTSRNRDEDTLDVEAYVSGRKLSNAEAVPGGDCALFLYGAGVAVRVSTCDTGQRMAVTLASSAAVARRVTVTWRLIASSDSPSRRSHRS